MGIHKLAGQYDVVRLTGPAQPMPFIKRVRIFAAIRLIGGEVLDLTLTERAAVAAIVWASSARQLIRPN